MPAATAPRVIIEPGQGEDPRLDGLVELVRDTTGRGPLLAASAAESAALARQILVVSRLEHLARDARIASNQNARTHIGLCTEIERRRAPEMICELRCQLRICLSTHAIRTKKSHHEQPPMIYIISIIYCILCKNASAAFRPSSAALMMPPA